MKKWTAPQAPMRPTTPVIGILEGQNKKGVAEVLEEIMIKNSPNLARDINVDIQEAEQIL